MMPNTALALVLLGIAGALRLREGVGRLPRTLALLAALAALAIGAGTLAQYVLGVDLRIDQLFGSVPSPVGLYPGRPSPPTALAVALLGAAILLFDARPTARLRPSEWLGLSAGLVGFTVLLGQIFGTGRIYRFSGAPVIGVAVPTAVSLLLTAVGLLLGRPGAGFMRVATSTGPGGLLLRRLALVTILAPMVLGLIVERLLPRVGLEDFPLVFATMAGAMTVASLALLFLTALPLDRTHQALESTRARTRELIELASDGIFLASLHGRYTDVNDAGCRMLGYSREEIVGKTIVELIPQAEVERLAQSKEQLLAGKSHVAEWTLRRKDGTYLPVEVSAKILPDGRWQGIVRDISERKLAEDRAHQAQERLELALRGADLASWDWNVKTGEVIFNPRWAEMRGYRPDELGPHVASWTAGVHPDDWPSVQKVLADCFEGRIRDYETEHRVGTKSGEWIWVLDRGRVFDRDAEGQPVRMVGTELDITERKRAEMALRLSEAKSTGIVAVSADAIISIDEDQRITMFNGGAEKIFGYSQAEVMGASLEMLIPERLRAVHRQHVERFAASGDVARRMGERGAVISGLRKDGREFPADAAISRLDVGERRLLTVALRDITEQKRIESEQTFLAEVGSVLASTLEYEDTLASIAQLMVRNLADLCVVDMVGEDGQVRRLKVVSRDPSKAWICELLLKMPLERGHPHLVWTVLETKRPVLMQGMSPEMAASFSVDEEHRRALLALDPRSLLAVPLMARGRLLGVIALVSATPGRVYGPADVRLAEQLAHRAALSVENARLYRVAQQAAQARDDVMGIVAHDLRNPLGAIRLQASLFRRRGPERERRSLKPAEVIERAVTRMDRLIQDLLDVTRMEGGRLSVEQTRLPAGQVLLDSVEAQKALASRSSLVLQLEVTGDLPEIWADRDRLLQVFENLIGNAIKFTGPDGLIVVGAAPRDTEVLFWVSDTGPGISADDLPHVFDRFWQAHKVERRGAGLGLPIVKGIVEAHGGHIWVESAPGRGSSFFFSIPAAPRADEWRQQPASHGA